MCSLGASEFAIIGALRVAKSCPATVLILLALLSSSTNSYCTSVAFAQDGKGIIIAVDSNEAAGSLAGMENISQDICKVAVLGNKYVFVATRAEAHTDEDLAPKWRATTEATYAYARSLGSLQSVAEAWGTQMVERLTSTYWVHSDLMEKFSGDGDLSDGYFVGVGKDGKLSVLLVLIEFTGSLRGQPRFQIETRMVNKLPFSPTHVTAELMAGKSKRAKTLAANWELTSMQIAKNDRVWRWLQYMVKATEDYDERVRGSVEVIEVEIAKSPHWLARQSCSP